MIALVFLALLVALLAMIRHEHNARRRAVDNLAEIAGVQRFPGEDDDALLARCGGRFRVISGGGRRV